MAADRRTPNSSTPTAVSGNAFMDDVNDEITALWNGICLPLTGIGGTANDLTASLAPALVTGMAEGMSFMLKPVSTNTGPMAISINDAPAIAIVRLDGSAFAGGEVRADVMRQLFFDPDTGDLRTPMESGKAQSTIATDSNFTLTALVGKILHTGTLTAGRTATLSIVGATAGDEILVTRSGSGAFMLSIGGLKDLATGTWCIVAFDGAAWYLAAYGAL